MVKSSPINPQKCERKYLKWANYFVHSMFTDPVVMNSKICNIKLRFRKWKVCHKKRAYLPDTDVDMYQEEQSSKEKVKPKPKVGLKKKKTSKKNTITTNDRSTEQIGTNEASAEQEQDQENTQSM